jgi:multiple sugar transport system ATP-binding protein
MTYLTLGDDPEIMVVDTGRNAVKAGDTVGVSIAPANVHLFDPATEKAI